MRQDSAADTFEKNRIDFFCIAVVYLPTSTPSIHGGAPSTPRAALCWSALESWAATYRPSDPNRIPDLLDLGISRGIDPAKVSTVGLCSDHSMVKVLLRTSLIRTPGSTKLIRRNTNTTVFRSWLAHPAISTGADIDDAAARLTGKVHHAARMATPTPRTNSGRLQMARRDIHLW